MYNFHFQFHFRFNTHRILIHSISSNLTSNFNTYLKRLHWITIRNFQIQKININWKLKWWRFQHKTFWNRWNCKLLYQICIVNFLAYRKIFHSKNEIYIVPRKTKCNMQILYDKLNYASTTFDQMKTYLFSPRYCVRCIYTYTYVQSMLCISRLHCMWIYMDENKKFKFLSG